MSKEIVQLAIDTYKGNLGEFSKDSANKTLREAFLEIAGTDKIDYKIMRRHKPELFEVIEESLNILIVEGLTDQFNDFVEIRNLAWGDSNIFNVTDPKLFKIATVADGTSNLRRQRIDSGSLTVGTKTHGVKIYEELYRFLAGRCDWNAMVDKVARSYNNKIASDIYTAVYDSYDILTTPFQKTGAFAEADMLAMIEHVETATGMEAVILGTRTSLSKVVTADKNISEKMKDSMNELGMYGKFNGTDMRVIKQAHKPGTYTYAINDSFVIVTPKVPDKMVKLVVEGNALILDETNSADMSMEYTFVEKAGTAVIKSAEYGIYRFQ